MSKKLKIKSTYIPEKLIETNEWFEIYKVGSRIEKYSNDNRAYFMNLQYDFQKVFRPTKKVNFVDRIKNLILADLW
jgi:hypothetical protein